MWDVLKTYGTELYEEWEKDNVSSLAAALAFYATLSLVPMVIIAVAVGGSWFGEEMIRERVLTELHLWVGPAAAEFARHAVAGATKASGTAASLLSLGALLLGATQLFAELQAALNRVWEIKPFKGKRLIDTIRRRLWALLLLAGMGALLIGSFVVDAGLSIANRYLGGFIWWELLNTGATFLLGTVMFSLLFLFFPAVKLKLRDVRLGAALTTFALMVAKYLLALYVQHAAITSTYGAAGTLVVFLLWVYISAQIVLVGAEFTQVHCRLQGRDVQIYDRAEARKI
jgi:membrane protein